MKEEMDREKLFVFWDILNNMTENPECHFLLIGKEDYFVLEDDETGLKDLIFHIEEGTNIDEFKDKGYLVIPSLLPQGNEIAETLIITQLSIKRPELKYIFTNHNPPKLYMSFGIMGGGRVTSSIIYTAINRDDFYEGLDQDGVKEDIGRMTHDLLSIL